MDLQQLGPYRIGARLGRGGMGTVFEGIEITTGERAAIKLLSPTLAAEPGFRERFESEIETLKKLRHPNIVRLHGWGEEDGNLFYAMELIEGTNLEQELRQGRRFTWREVTDVGIALCKALKHAHDRGVIHRDIKPANLMLTPSGEIKLSDFGIAKLFGAVGLTVDGGVLGTAEYMSPEQADGRPVTARCDLYSVGGVLYALLAGRPPFRAKTLPEMLQLQRFAAPEPVRRYAPDAPAELDDIVMQLLEKEPEQRIANALVLGRRLAAMARGLSLTDSQSSAPETGDTDFDFGPAAAPSSASSPAPSSASRSSPAGPNDRTSVPGSSIRPAGAPPASDIAGPTDLTRAGGALPNIAGPNDHTRVAPASGEAYDLVGETQAATTPDRPPIDSAATGVAPPLPISEAPTGVMPPAPPGGASSVPSSGAPPVIGREVSSTSIHPATNRNRAPDTVRPEASTAVAGAASTGELGKPKSTFTVAAEEEVDLTSASPREPQVLWAQVGLLALALASLAAIAWYLSRPKSADALYHQIATAAATGDTQDLALIDDEVAEFLERYPSDSRQAEVADYQAEIADYRGQASVRQLARALQRKPSLEPVERAYLDAIRDAQLQPRRAIERLDALLALYGDPRDDSGGKSRSAARCLEVAERHLAQLREELTRADEVLQTALRAKLDRAAQLAPTDPAAAQRIRRAIVELYADEPAANTAVEEARRALGE